MLVVFRDALLAPRVLDILNGSQQEPWIPLLSCLISMARLVPGLLLRLGNALNLGAVFILFT